MSASSLVELGERYWALGLPAAARGAFAQAQAVAAPNDATPARLLAEIALATGDVAAARGFAAEVAKRAPGADARLLVGRAALAAGELSAARRSFVAALDAAGGDAGLAPLIRARAHLGCAAAAIAGGDRPGAGAHAIEAFAGLLAFATAAGRRAEDLDGVVGIAEEIVAQAVSHGRGADAAAQLAEAGARRPGPPLALLDGLLLAARQAMGDPVPDGAIEAALARELEARPGSVVTRLRLVERRLRRRGQDPAVRAEAVAALEAMTGLPDVASSGSPDGAPVPPLPPGERARAWFLLAAAYEDDGAGAIRAEAAYRAGLRLRPSHAGAASRLAELTLARGDSEAALSEIERALRIDAGHGLAWRQAARVLDAAGPSPGPNLPQAVERLLDAANPGAGTAAAEVAPRLVTATAELARGDMMAGMHAHGHRMKNLLGIIGSRTRSARKLAQGGDESGELVDKLRDLEAEVTTLYNEWATYLRSMQTAGPVVEVVPLVPLLAEVVEAASARIAVPVSLVLGTGLPDLRGDRLLLREALLNIVCNGAEACLSGAGQVTVRVRMIAMVATGGAPVVEIQIADTGPGIPRADLSRIFAPGFTTKETGSGVGLTIAERVVSAHHGRILIESDEGRGTCVTVVLPSDLGGFATLGTLTGQRPEEPAS